MTLKLQLSKDTQFSKLYSNKFLFNTKPKTIKTLFNNLFKTIPIKIHYVFRTISQKRLILIHNLEQNYWKKNYNFIINVQLQKVWHQDSIIKQLIGLNWFDLKTTDSFTNNFQKTENKSVRQLCLE